MLVAATVGVVWGLIAFFAFRGAVQQSNERVPDEVRKVLAATDGPALASGRNILLIGSDSRKNVGRGDASDVGRADSMILMRFDPPRRRYSVLSIPRDLRVDVPGYGQEKVNAAYQLGGPALTVRTIRQLTGLPVHHYMLIDFAGFKDVVDSLGGITVNNPRAIRSERFDGYVWRFRKGENKLDGRHALAYARVRRNVLNLNESDLTRAARQQAVLDAISAKVVSFHSVLHPRGTPRAVMSPLTTDATASQLVAFGIGKKWASGALRCRLGGSLDFAGGQSVLVGDEDNRAVVRMFLGQQPPVKPNVQSNAFAPGCTKT